MKMNIHGTTQVLGVFGYPVEHSLSPKIHNAAFNHLNLDYCYLPFNVKPDMLKNAVRAITALNFRGVNVTVPHKEKVIRFLDRVDAEASFIGAVNTIVNDNGILTGYNTDGRGFMESLSEAGIMAEGKTILILGAGGASRAISYYLCKKAVKLYIYDIAAKKTMLLVKDLAKIYSNVNSLAHIESLRSIDILINATPLGLKENDTSPVDVSLITEHLTVCDLIYKKTPFLSAASGKKCRTIDGSGMLIHQGALAFEMWTGIKAPVNIMRNVISDYITKNR